MASIHPLALLRYSQIDDEHLNDAISVMVDQIASVSSFEVDDQIVSVRILSLLGDTPATAAIAGFKQSVSANHPCRIC